MSVTKDGDTGRWMSQIRVTDWTGKTIHKKKRGFATKKEALQWERDFISQSTGSLGMTFGDFISLYVKDMEHRLKPSTVASKKWLIDLKVTPCRSICPIATGCKRTTGSFPTPRAFCTTKWSTAARLRA